MQLILILIGAMLGVSLRYLFINILNIGIYSIMLINISGSFALGFINTLNANQLINSSLLHKAVTVGIIGAFTTFSTFIGDIVNLLIKKQYTTAFIYFFASISISIIFMLIGIYVANKISSIK
ncbi:hypothetical protein HMPREF9628_00119 [Peptoanaerobacter stomatis]|uniref:Fluoride-specific ion channel FluC n=1 Tax=Peptoanaerobacter stomatis TaxID=796937 RepID=G9XA28_9FIRM|nr:CrcB family protein [Peptoanaerobacter stomatis]EHL20274.1 hypothetical protein HMPREF9628_00119 [Peptoanaerobacter stomatis]